MKCGACKGSGRAYSCGAPVDCSACFGRGTVPEPSTDTDRRERAAYIRSLPAKESRPMPPTSDDNPHPDPPPDYPGLTDPDGAMVAFMVRCKADEHGGPYLPAYLAGWFLAACRAPLPTECGQFRDSIRGGYRDCEERQSAREKNAARPVECERVAVASDLRYAARGYDDAGKREIADGFRLRAEWIMAGKHRDEPERE